MKRYRLLKNELMEANRGKCSYCGKEIDSLYDATIDNFYPKSTYPELADDINNQILSCRECNATKSDSFPLDSNGNALLLNPYFDNINEHIQILAGGLVKGISERGIAMISALNLNRSKLIQQRLSQVIDLNFARQLSDEALNHILSSSYQSHINASEALTDDEIDTSLLEIDNTAPASNEAQFISWFDNLTPSSQLLISLFLSYWLNIFSSLSMPWYQDWAHFFESDNTRVAVKSVIQDASQSYHEEVLKGFRFVIATSLNVRELPTKKADVIYHLSNGNVVRFIERSKAWVKVEFLCPDTGDVLNGWVFARYLSKFE